jgi:hypothetical protein
MANSCDNSHRWHRKFSLFYVLIEHGFSTLFLTPNSTAADKAIATAAELCVRSTSWCQMTTPNLR